MVNKEFRSPVYHIIAVPFENIVPNTYNPNNVAPPEMRLLYDSIKEDGYTMPIVCYYAKGSDKYVIVDGFHRWRVMRDYPDIYEREKGMMPVSIIDKPLSGRMASTIRHNRARGTHDVDLMSNIIKELYEFSFLFIGLTSLNFHRGKEDYMRDTESPYTHTIFSAFVDCFQSPCL